MGLTRTQTGLVVVPTVLTSHMEQLHRLRSDLLHAAPNFMKLTFVVICNSNATAARDYPGFIALRPARNLGYGRAANFAWDTLGPYDWLLLLNDDLVLSDTAFLATVLEEVFRDQSSLHSLGPSSELAWLRVITPGLHVFRSLSLVGAAVNAFRRRSQTQVAGDQVQPGHVTGLPGLAVSGWAYEALCGFDPRYTLYFEDTDFIIRAQEAGISVRTWRLHAISHRKSSSRGARRNDIMQVEASSALLFLQLRGKSPARAAATLVLAAIVRLIVRSVRDPIGGIREARAVLRSVRNLSGSDLPYDGWSTEGVED